MTLEKAAIKWWGMRRPWAWTRKKHLENPTVNCIGNAEKNLALAVAAALKGTK